MSGILVGLNKQRLLSISLDGLSSFFVRVIGRVTNVSCGELSVYAFRYRVGEQGNTMKEHLCWSRRKELRAEDVLEIEFASDVAEHHPPRRVCVLGERFDADAESEIPDQPEDEVRRREGYGIRLVQPEGEFFNASPNRVNEEFLFTFSWLKNHRCKADCGLLIQSDEAARSTGEDMNSIFTQFQVEAGQQVRLQISEINCA